MSENKPVGRPVGWRKAEGIRKQRQIRAYDDEWELIQKFCRELKHGDKEKCVKFVEDLGARAED